MLVTKTNRRSTSSRKDLLFSGLNRNEFIADTEIKAGTNLSSEYLPALAHRLPRTEVYPSAPLSAPNALFTAGGKLCWIDGNNFVYDGEVKGTVDGSKKHSLLDFNGRVIIYPEMLFYNYEWLLNDDFEWGNFGAGECNDLSLFEGHNATIDLRDNEANTGKYFYFSKHSIRCTATGTGYFGCKTKDGAFHIDYALNTRYFLFTAHVSSGNGSAKLEILNTAGTVVKTSATKTVANDTVRLGVAMSPSDSIPEFPRFRATRNGTGAGDIITVDGLQIDIITEEEYDSAVADMNAFMLTKPFRPIPNIDFVSQNYNRVFGCKGSDIYASAWGDFKTWGKFEGTDQDSFATDVSTEGDFTGICTFGGHVTFFKDDNFEELYGTLPRNFQTMPVSGFGAISNDAIASGSGYLFFADARNIYAYTGGRPTPIGFPLNEKGYKDVKLACNGERLYAVYVKQDDSKTMYCYDIKNRSWMPEDDLDVVAFTTLNQKVYALDADGKIWLLGEGDEVVDWSAETKVFDDGLYEKKKAKNIKLKLKMAAGASISIYSSKNDGGWVLEHTVTNDNDSEEYSTVRKVVSISRASRYQLKFVGHGDILVYGEREFDVGSQF